MNKKDKQKQAIIYGITIVLSLIFVICGFFICKPDEFRQGIDDYYKAKVISIEGSEEVPYFLDDGFTEITNKRVVFTAKMLSGPYEGDVITAVQDIDDMNGYKIREVKSGDEILVARPGYDMSSGAMGDEVGWVFTNYNRIGSIVWFGIIFLLLIVLIGRKKGLSTILALIFTVLSIFFVFIPAILKGYNVYLMTIIICVFSVLMSLIIINGWNRKTVCAIIGNLLGIAAAGLMAVIMNNAFEITGRVDADYVNLAITYEQLDLRAIVWSGVVIGALGAIMDVAMSIASSMQELNDTMRDKSFFRMLHSGMNIGRDAIGTMTNTLILAYIGGAIATVLLNVTYKNMYDLFSWEMITTEILSAISGSIGILAAVPATAIISAYVFNRYPDKKRISE